MSKLNKLIKELDQDEAIIDDTIRIEDIDKTDEDEEDDEELDDDSDDSFNRRWYPD
jgi:hypothetical protein